MSYKNILVYALVNLGDVVFSTASLGILRQAYPTAKITYMARPGIATVLKNHPYIDEVIEYNYKSKSDKLSVFSMAKKINKYHFDLSIALDCRARTAIITWLAGIPTRIGASKLYGEKRSFATKFYTKTIAINFSLSSKLQHETFQYFMQQITGTTASFKPIISSAPIVNQNRALELLCELPQKKMYIPLCVQAVFALKAWQANKFAQVIDILSEKYDPAFFIVGTSEDKEYVDNLILQTKTPVANFCGRTNLLDLVALFEKSSLMLTIDNGAAHVAAALNLPIVSIFGCTTPKRAKPSSDLSIALGGTIDCCPCDKRVHECPEHFCMAEISVDSVVEAVDELILEMEITK